MIKMIQIGLLIVEYLGMNKMVNRQKIYEESEDFFALNGNYIMKLSAEAAIEVCKKATEKNLYILKIEGGIWHNPGFEARIDCIWDSLNDLSKTSVQENNQEAMNFIIEEKGIHDAFIMTMQGNTRMV